MADHLGTIFKDGPSGRRAALAYGADVWEVIKFLCEVDERGPAAIAVAEVFAVDTSRISTAISYYGDYSDKIDLVPASQTLRVWPVSAERMSRVRRSSSGSGSDLG